MTTEITLRLDAEALATLDALVARTTAKTRGEVLRDALGLYVSLADMLTARDGNALAMVNRKENEIQDLTVPSLRAKLRLVP